MISGRPSAQREEQNHLDADAAVFHLDVGRQPQPAGMFSALPEADEHVKDKSDPRFRKHAPATMGR
jgi:hypothetical protein